jgi:hypothetical protein
VRLDPAIRLHEQAGLYQLDDQLLDVGLRPAQQEGDIRQWQRRAAVTAT